ncbi:MAG TPA: hypothetical protein VEG60_09800 [Candidatus Binatia bacterium]|nr:hypothetical protein [Candidatus Binatia bacterium]
MQRYNGYLIEGKVAMIHPYEPSHYSERTILKHGRGGSVVEVGRVELPSFTVETRGLAEWFGLELSRIAVDECLVRR